MSYYGNILTLYNSTAQQEQKVATALADNDVNYEKVGSTYFIRSRSKKNTREVLASIAALNIEYSFFHNAIPTRSYFRADGIDRDTIDRIQAIMGTDI